MYVKLCVVHQMHSSLTSSFTYPPAICKAVYAANAIESLDYSLHRVTKASGSFPSDEVAPTCTGR